MPVQHQYALDFRKREPEPSGTTPPAPYVILKQIDPTTETILKYWVASRNSRGGFDIACEAISPLAAMEAARDLNQKARQL